ncbi:exodeoxyribonuclease V subunit gamma [Pseudonocardia sp. MH-G8]|uniref:exodeoxyribonuclease V subunit gamma n=1 Tax=Pseudonocardia sp. MH-G8 TaxID=1854588 RepID=UPI000B9FFF15|nr:exodeoxyribonuclease V subunit gamma [Pseudonocardia sp. MH-G8]OZM77324.1 exodeoxyribonuclease V subunit gamma [Pseudonocardia sp. MH-G8]
MWHLHRAERADALVRALGELLAEPLEDPFASEVVAVPARGVERWLAQQLSHRLGAAGGRADGVCAGVAFPSPTALVAEVVSAAAGVGADEDPWLPERAVWPLVEVIDESVGEPWCAPLGAHLDSRTDNTGQGRRYAVARHLADLFAAYAAHRPAMLTAWLAGATVGESAADLNWQPELYRRLRARIDAPSPAERLEVACAALRADPAVAPLPARLSVFGPTRLPAEHLAVLAALAEHREVHLWLPHPSPALWSALQPPPAVPHRRTDPTAATPRHPLLGSLGRDARELQLRLAAAAPQRVDVHHPVPERPAATLLEHLQADLRHDRAPDGGFALRPDDRSVQVHSCHGPDRQVEVLREVVLGLLQSDPTLEPRDVLVMCPDVETFAPLVSACFGLADGPDAHPGQHLQVRLADRALRQVNPLLDTVAQLLELADARVTASQLLDLLATAPVRRRFDLDEADLDRLRELVHRSGVRWGLDAAHRAPFQLDGFPQNTWSAGLDRLLLGVTMSGAEHDWLGTALPMDEVESGDVARVGRLAEFVDRVAAVLAGLAGAQPLERWIALLVHGLDVLTLATGTDEWQGSQARAELAAAGRAAGPHAATVALGLADVRGLLAERLRGRPTRANFRTGTLTVATLVPMRSVPHRVICLLGMDDGVFPRAGVPDGDDVLAREPLVGERDPRSEDRQLLLDAICAATEHLVVVHSGADERSGARRPPAVPLGELLDTVAATAGPGALEQVVVRHPLQPFDPANFGSSVPFSFDRAELAGARAAAGSKSPPAPFLAEPLPPTEDPGVVSLDELVAFVEHPTKEFLRQRVGLSLFTADEQQADALPVDLDGLATWAVGDRLLRDRLAGHPLDRCRQAEWRRGELPPGALGERVLAGVLDDVEPLVSAALPHRVGEPQDRDVDVALPDGTRVVGTVGGLHVSGTNGSGTNSSVLLRVEFSRLAAKQRVRAWVRLLALTAATREPWRAVTIGRGTRFGLSMATAGPLDPERAAGVLAELVALRRAGLREPLPLPTVAGHTYATTRRGGADAGAALEEALRKWSTGAGAERNDAAHVRVWGPAAGPEVLSAPGAPGGEPTRFGALALQVWNPLLGAEDVVRL